MWNPDIGPGRRVKSSLWPIAQAVQPSQKATTCPPPWKRQKRPAWMSDPDYRQPYYHPPVLTRSSTPYTSSSETERYALNCSYAVLSRRSACWKGRGSSVSCYFLLAALCRNLCAYSRWSRACLPLRQNWPSRASFAFAIVKLHRSALKPNSAWFGWPLTAGQDLLSHLWHRC